MDSLAQWLKQQILRRYSSNYSHPGRKGMHREALKSKNASVQGGQGSCTRWKGCSLETQLCWPQAPDWNSSSTFGIYKTPSSWDMEAYLTHYLCFGLFPGYAGLRQMGCRKGPWKRVDRKWFPVCWAQPSVQGIRVEGFWGG